MQITVRAFELESVLERAPEGIEVLSLDCFDTLIWRNTHSPVEMFAELGIEGGGIEPRTWHEKRARDRAYKKDGRTEINLTDIYTEMLPGKSAEAVAAAVEAELDLEVHHCYAFAPIVALMRRAKAAGLKIIIVSDMYIDEAQLRDRIARSAGEEVLALIDHVFVSYAHGVSKGDDLFPLVLETLGVSGDKVLHIGDNAHADFASANEHGLHAVHFVQFDDAAVTRLRMEAATARVLDPLAGISRAVCQPHRAPIALRASDEPAYALGYDVLGPGLTQFAHWIRSEIDAASAEAGRPVRPLFMMRDGYLPYLVFNALYPEYGAQPVEMSRFVALRTSLRNDAALENYLDKWVGHLPPVALARQLMLFENEYTRFLKGPLEDQAEAMGDWVRKNSDIRRKIFTRRNTAAKNFFTHLKNAGVEKGDTVMMVDIGYHGSVQDILTPVLTEELGLQVMGRYLFLREKGFSGLNKRGLIDPRRFDNRLLHAMSQNIVVLEQLFNIEQGSTIGFNTAGVPVRESVDAKASHSPTRSVVQGACLDYARTADKAMLRAPASDTEDSRSLAVAASFARLFFLPSTEETALFEGFHFDFNMGSDYSEVMVDPERGRTGMRRQGLVFYNECFSHFRSGEIQAQGLPITLANFTAARFKLDFRTTDFEVGGLKVSAILATAVDQGIMPFTAWPTAEGYYQLRIPIGPTRPTVAVQLGQLCEWVQVEHAEFIRLADLRPTEFERKSIPAPRMADAMTEMSPGLYRAEPTGLLMVPPPPGTEPMLLSLVFRPVVLREASAALRIAA